MGLGLRAPMRINLMPRRKNREVDLEATLLGAYKMYVFHLKKEIQDLKEIIVRQEKVVDIQREYIGYLEKGYSMK